MQSLRRTFLEVIHALKSLWLRISQMRLIILLLTKTKAQISEMTATSSLKETTPFLCNACEAGAGAWKHSPLCQLTPYYAPPIGDTRGTVQGWRKKGFACFHPSSSYSYFPFISVHLEPALSHPPEISDWADQNPLLYVQEPRLWGGGSGGQCLPSICQASKL